MKTKRHAKILELIQANCIDTQEELLRNLREHGFNVTQATVSRDIKELRLVKSLDSTGKYRYMAVQQDNAALPSRFQSVFSDAVTSIDCAMNLIVVKCYAGMANAVCAAMDSLEWEGVAGTLAGDDTFLIVCRSEQIALSLSAELKSIVNR